MYSTCSLSPDENECTLQDLLDRHPGLETEAVTLPDVVPRMPGLASWQGQRFADALQHAVRILPSAYTDAFFICRLRKPV